MIEYRKSNLDDVSIRLLGKLGQDKFPLESVKQMIQNKRATVIKVFYDEKLYGILVVRGINLHCGELCMVIDHAIAEDNIEIHFGSILAESLFNWVANEKFKGHYFKHIHQHAHNPALKRILETHYGEAKEFIFKKDVREFKNARRSNRETASTIPDVF